MSTAHFLEEFEELVNAGASTFIIQTREPFRCVQTIAELVISDGNLGQFRSWSRTNGWSPAYGPPLDGHTDARNVYKPLETGDRNPDVMAALGMLSKTHHEHPFPMGIYAMVNAHYELSEPLMMQVIADYSLELSMEENSKCLVMIVPESFQVPEEIKNMVSVLDFLVPNQAELSQRYTELIEDQKLEEHNQFTDDNDLQAIAAAGSGLSMQEFDTAVRQALVRDTSFSSGDLFGFTATIMRAKIAVVNKVRGLEVVEAVPMSEVGGLENLKEFLTEIKPSFTKKAQKHGVDPAKGFLIVGLPGGGKSTICKAVAGDLNLPVVRFNIAAMFGEFVGSSERNVQVALNYIAALSPCVVWFDEIDKAGLGSKGGNDSGASARVTSTLLFFMAEQRGVFFIATANRAELIDPELTRAGRFDAIFGAVFPNKVEREDIIKIHLKKRKQKVKEITDIHLAVSASKHYVGAEIELAVKNAVRAAFNTGQRVTGKLVAKQFDRIVPISRSAAESCKRMIAWVEAYALPASKSDEEYEKKEGKDSGKIRLRMPAKKSTKKTLLLKKPKRG